MTMLYYCYIDVISYLVFSKCCLPKIIEALHITTLVLIFQILLKKTIQMPEYHTITLILK